MKTLKNILVILTVLLFAGTAYAQPGPNGDYRKDNYEHLYDGSVQAGMYYFDSHIMPSDLTTATINGKKYFACSATNPATRMVETVMLTQEHIDTVNTNYEKGFATLFKPVPSKEYKVFTQSMGRAKIKEDGTVVLKRQGDELEEKARKKMEKRRRKELRKSNGGNKGYGDRKGTNSAPGSNGSNTPATQQRQRKPIVWGVQTTVGARTPVGDVIVTTGVGDNGDGDGLDVNVGGTVVNQWGTVSGGGTNEPMMQQGNGNGLMINGQQPINGMLNQNNLPPVLNGGCANCYQVP